ncbi:TolC family protein [Parasediminibacterium paludis]|uniref:TolC family protein n=1 Tax=Parasediminibacterium paludis TaxID=908966 RepID=A0ABV8Q0X6_9BACT
MFKRIFIPFVSLFLVINSNGQKPISEADAVNMALKNSRNISAAALSVLQQKQLLKSTINLPNPEVFIESPTGNFYTGSITQSIEFPTVYGKQYQLQKQKIVLAEKEKGVSENDVKLQVKQLYLLLQYAVALQQQLFVQDTVYQRISTAGGRQFDAGQIDYLQKTVAESQYGEVHNQYVQAQISITNLQSQLQYLTGSQEVFTVFPLDNNQLTNKVVPTDSTLFDTNPSLQIANQNTIISQNNIDLQKAKALPGLALGYFNQGERSTPIGNRFRFGFTVPLWFGQYKSNIAAAKTELDINKQKVNGLQQQLSVQLLQAQNELAVYTQSLQYYQTTGLKKANEIITTAKRLFDNGQNDYIGYLRNINDAYSIQLKYLEAIKNYNLSVLSIKYLTGTL